MGEDYIKETQNTLGKIIKKPPMTTKLLTKPPFRFLHDIITEVVKETGFMKGLHTDSELDSSNVKDKESKIAFLQKAIDLVALVTGKPLSVRPSKVVAGHEPEKTNEFLQAIAKACKSQPDSSDAVQRVLKGEKPGSGKPPRPKKDDGKKRESSAKKESDKDEKDRENSSDNRNRSSSKDRDGKRDGSQEKNGEAMKGRDKESRQRDKAESSKDRGKDRSKDRGKDTDKERSKDRDKERSKDRDKGQSKDRDKGRSKVREREKDRSNDRVKDRGKEKIKERGKERRERDKDGVREKSGIDNEAEQNGEQGRSKDDNRKEQRKKKEEPPETAKPAEQNEIHNDDGGEDMRPVNGEIEDGVSSNRIPRPSSAKGQRRRPTKDSNSGESDQKPSSKHSREDLVDGEEKSPAVPHARRSARPSSARPAPPRLKKQESTDKDESRVGSGKQVSNVIVDNAHNSEEEESFVVEAPQQLVDDEPGPIQTESLEDDGDHGGLVKKILETKKELEGTQNEQKEKEKPVIMDAAHRKQQELVQREVEKLRGSIQTLTRSANPLGKIMDYLQEDVDSMQKELETWKKENREQELAIKREQSITDSELEPPKVQLTELDQSIRDQVDAIAMVKSNILKNDERIKKMMGSVAFS